MKSKHAAAVVYGRKILAMDVNHSTHIVLSDDMDNCGLSESKNKEEFKGCRKRAKRAY
jgi:hypothetical protein